MWSYPSTDWSVTAIVPFFQRNSLQLQETVDEDLAGCQRWHKKRGLVGLKFQLSLDFSLQFSHNLAFGGIREIINDSSKQ